ncbi:hypothetical protein [Thiothrix lacustris]|uniref:hypothetical protein n=1 Tax=Thiothrix lacustris TaxID=525917 RepID=UPI00048E2245|nr:hypothetical protein [Thiothrix lacustris]
MGMFDFWNTQTEDEYVKELARDAASAGLKAVAVTALNADGDCHTASAVRGEGFVGKGVDEWNHHLATYTHTHADRIDPDTESQPTSFFKSLFGG